jgi:D-alanyl-D-alanine carboxypeptidase/D-alanyl-D-alanine-endopeptidase (penicillin-binding protein 4)
MTITGRSVERLARTRPRPGAARALLALAAAGSLAGLAAPAPAAPPAPRATPARTTPARTTPARTTPARPTPPRAAAATRAPQQLTVARDPKKLGALARVAFGRAGELRPARDLAAAGRRAEPLTPEEETAEQIQKLLRGPLRAGVTGLFVADARSGEPLFAVNASDPLNPASNVKMISTATALDLLGPEFRYPTRLLGATPVDGVVKSDIYLLGSHDPTLTAADLDELARAVAARGVTAIEGGIVVGADPTRDGLYRATLPIEIAAGEPGKPPTARAPAGDLVSIKIAATTARAPMVPRLTYKQELSADERGQPRITLTIGGVIGKGGALTYPMPTQLRTAAAAYAVIAALRAHGIAVAGERKQMELGDFVGATVALGSLPVELGRHESRQVAEIVATINKWSINWLADRLIMTAAGLTARKPPSMEVALDAMYGWLARHPHLGKQGIVLDTGSGLSYNTQISSQELVSVVRSAAGFVPDDTSRDAADAWLHSLSIAGTDGTLARRFRGTTAAGRIFGKTGTLSTSIALSGVLDVDPQRPLAFSLVTNSDAPLPSRYIRRAHELVLAEICKYLAKTSPRLAAAPAPVAAPAMPAAPAAPAPAAAAAPPDHADELLGEDFDPKLDAETLQGH